MSEGTYDDDLTPPQEYLIAGIVISLFGLLYWYLNYQWDSESGVSITSTTEVVETHRKADFSAEPVRDAEKTTPPAKTPARVQAERGVTSTQGEQASSADTSVVNKNAGADFQVKAMPSKSVLNQSIPSPDESQQVVEQKTKSGNTEKATFIDLPEKQDGLSADDNKKNTYALPDGTDVKIASEGFESDLRDAMETGTSNKPLLFDNVYFKSGSSIIDEKSTHQIHATAALLNTYPQHNILLRGHTDNTGEPGANIQLSLARANEMGLALGRLGIKLERIRIIGVGDAEPIATNDTEAGRSQNRRIEILLLN